MKADFETSFFTVWAQGLKPGAFGLWVEWIQLVQPHLLLQRAHRVHDLVCTLLQHRLGVGLSLTPGGYQIGYIHGCHQLNVN